MTVAPPVSLHRPAPWYTIAGEQLRSVALSLRKEAVAFVVVWVAFFGLALRAAITSVGSATPHIRFDFIAATGLPIVAVALLIPLSVWRGEGLSDRGYHWAMPYPRTSHTLTKVAGGLVCVEVAVATYLVLVEVLIRAIRWIAHTPALYHAAWWEWTVPFAASAITYAVGSAIAVGVKHPSRWAMGAAPVILMAALAPRALGLEWFRVGMVAAWQGSYGLATALGVAIADTTGRPDSVRWAGAALLWGCGSAIAVLLAARRRVAT